MPEALLTLSALAGYATLYAAVRSNTAVSAEAFAVRDQASALVADAENSRALFGAKAGVLSNLRAIANEHTEPGRDGEGSGSVSQAAVRMTADFIRALPEGLPMPEVDVDPDGAISLDWIYSRHGMFSVSLGVTNRLAYAWLDGVDSGHAVARFDGAKIPAGILQGIESIMGCATTFFRAA